jgi:hypothetical protein
MMDPARRAGASLARVYPKTYSFHIESISKIISSQPDEGPGSPGPTGEKTLEKGYNSPCHYKYNYVIIKFNIVI